MSDMEKNASAAAAQQSAPQAEQQVKPDKAEKAKDKPAKKEKDKKPSVTQRISRWFREMRSELKKVSWPSARDTMKNVAVVLVCVIVVGLVIAVFDTLVRAVVDALLNLF